MEVGGPGSGRTAADFFSSILPCQRLVWVVPGGLTWDSVSLLPSPLSYMRVHTHTHTHAHRAERAVPFDLNREPGRQLHSAGGETEAYVRESHNIKSLLIAPQPQLHRFCVLSTPCASSPVQAPKCGELARDCPSPPSPPGPVPLWPGVSWRQEDGKAWSMFQFGDVAGSLFCHPHPQEASSTPGKPVKTLGSQRSINPTHLVIQTGEDTCLLHSVSPRGRGCLGQSLPAEDSRGEPHRGPRGQGRASCEDWVSPVTLALAGLQMLPSGWSTSTLAASYPVLPSPQPSMCTHHSEQCHSHPLAQPR